MRRSSEVWRITWGERKLEEKVVKFKFKKFMELLTSIDTGDGDVTDSSGFDNISDDKLLDCLVFWNATSTVGATDSLHMTAVVLAASSITTFLGLQNQTKTNKKVRNFEI